MNLTAARLWHLSCVIMMLLIGTFSGAVLAFLGQIVLARELEVAEFGRLAALLAIVNLFTPVATAGVNWFVLRVFGAEGVAAVRWLRPATWLVAVATALSCIGLVAYIKVSELAPDGAGPIIVASILVLLGQVAVELGSASLQLSDRLGTLAWWQMITQTGRFAIVAASLLFSSITALSVMIGYGVLGLVLTGLGIAFARSTWRNATRETGPSLQPHFWRTAAEATPYALITIFYIIYFQGTVALIALIAGNAAAAEYNAAFLIFSAISLIPNVIYMKFMAARLCRWAERDRSSFAAAFHLGVPAMALCGFCLAVLLASTAHWLIPLIFGAKYANVERLVLIRAVAIPIGFVQMAYSSLFISRSETSLKVRYLGATAVVSVGLNLALVPIFGVTGGTVASVVAEAVLLLLHMHGVIRHIAGIAIGDTLRLATLINSARHFLVPEANAVADDRARPALGPERGRVDDMGA